MRHKIKDHVNNGYKIEDKITYQPARSVASVSMGSQLLIITTNSVMFY